MLDHEPFEIEVIVCCPNCHRLETDFIVVKPYEEVPKQIFELCEICTEGEKGLSKETIKSLFES